LENAITWKNGQHRSVSILFLENLLIEIVRNWQTQR